VKITDKKEIERLISEMDVIDCDGRCKTVYLIEGELIICDDETEIKIEDIEILYKRTQIFTHGDMHVGNIAFERSSESYIYDFYDKRYRINYIEFVPKIIDFGTSWIRDKLFYNKIQEKQNQSELFNEIFGKLDVLYSYDRYIFDGYEMIKDEQFDENKYIKNIETTEEELTDHMLLYDDINEFIYGVYHRNGMNSLDEFENDSMLLRMMEKCYQIKNLKVDMFSILFGKDELYERLHDKQIFDFEYEGKIYNLIRIMNYLNKLYDTDNPIIEKLT
jgi:hypothetical protein